MLAEEILPLPREFIKHEMDTLDLIRNSPFMLQEHEQLAEDARRLHSQLRAKPGWFELQSSLDFHHEERQLRVFITGIVQQRSKQHYEMATYCVTVCGNSAGRLSLLRKLHFDVATTADSRAASRMRKPVCHVQYCGELSPFLVQQGLTEADIAPFHPWLSEPRVLLWPACTALLVDMLLHEFQHKKSAAFRARPEWRNIVWRSEQLLLKKFYSKCFEVLENRNKQNKIIGDVVFAD